jgi:fluoride exporter
MTWWEWLLVGLAGAAGAPLRYVVDNVVSDRMQGSFPLGTLAVNVSGSLALGLLTGLVIYHGLPGRPNLILGTGLIGSYTTFSTFSFETVGLLEEGETGLAVRNVLANALAGAAVAAAGLALAAL